MTEEVRRVPTREPVLAEPGPSIFEKLDEYQEQLDKHLQRFPLECNLLDDYCFPKN